MDYLIYCCSDNKMARDKELTHFVIPVTAYIGIRSVDSRCFLADN